MKMKITILMILFIILSINNVYGETEYFKKSASQQYHYEYTSNTGYTPDFPVNIVIFNDIGTMAGINSITLKIKNDYWDGENSAWGNVEYHINSAVGALIGTGTFGYNNGTDYVFIIATFDDDNNFSDYSGQKKVYIVGGPEVPISDGLSYLPHNMDTTTTTKVYLALHDGYNFLCASHKNTLGESWTNSYTTYNFINSYTYISDEYLNKLDIGRVNNQSMWTVVRGGNVIFEDFELNSTNQPVYDNDLINSTWNIMCNDSYGNTYTDIISFEPIDDTPTLTTDKTTYNTSEQITISYTNIDKIYDECTSSFCDESYQLWIYALDTTENIPKFRQWLYSDRRDETFTLNTSILLPQTDYQLMITSGESNVVISSDIFYVYPDDEYLSISCDKDAGCITYNGIKNIIYYKINNDSNIIIKDNDNNIINTYYNIIGTGVITYTIPRDIEHLNIYPNWKVYLNNTDYSTSYNKNMEVYWSLFIEPTETPTPYPTVTPDINISDQLDNLTVEIQPLKELLYGFVYIVIDNPDYNNDNIINENEINHWFNSLIPMCLFLLLITLYIGLKKNRD